jgi:hypothetical protein
MNILLNCEPGSDISDAFQEAIELSNRIQFDVEFTFNDVTCFVKPNGSVRKGVEEYHEAIGSKSQYKFAKSY